MRTYFVRRTYKIKAESLDEAKRILRRDTPTHSGMIFSLIYSGGLFLTDEKWKLKSDK